MRAYLQLVRLPNVFTAMADILLGYLFTHARLEPAGHFALLLAASSMLYLAGMVLNDYFDQEQDARERPARPLPSGRVTPQAARLLGGLLLVGGTACGWAATIVAGDPRPGVVATLLAAAVVLYDGVLKRTPLAPAVMGGCRTLNVLLGLSLSPDPWQTVHYVLAAGVGVYIAGVTLFARTEARTSGRGQLTAGLLIFLAGMGLLASLPRWASGQEWPPIVPPERWDLFWLALAAVIGWRAVRAVIEPIPANVQAAVRNCIFSLIILDAAAVLAVQDRFWALVILALLIPTMTLGRWLYAT